MEEIVIALGSNLGDRLEMLKKADSFLNELSKGQISKSSIWETEPIGDARYTFYNAAVKIYHDTDPLQILKELKNFEIDCGREVKPVKWGPRIIDLDIICYGNLVIDNETLIIPHPEYQNRLFVLKPMVEVHENWIDPRSSKSVKTLIDEAPDMDIKKTEIRW